MARRCRVCESKFEPTRPMQPTCSDMKCMVAYATDAALRSRTKREKKAAHEQKAQRKRDKERLLALRPLSYFAGLAQKAFNEWIRWRDRDEPCISCGRHHKGAHDAGHYRTVGSNPALRFNEDNCHKQCVPCNRDKHGNAVEYRLRLLDKIGPERLAVLEGPWPAAHLSRDDLIELQKKYAARTRDEKKGG